MAIQTNIVVSAFNIIRYLLFNIVIDAIVRKSLDSFENFRRRLSLHRGQPVSLAGHRIDKYNLLRIFRSRHLPSASLLFFITALAYGVEVALEYAVDSSAARHAIRGNITRVEYATGVCSEDAIITSNNALLMAFIAEQCVRFEDGTYRLFQPIWVRDKNGTESILCEAVEDNKLYEGQGLYGLERTSKESPETLDLMRTLTEHSYRTIGDVWHSGFVVHVSSADVWDTRTFTSPLSQITKFYFTTEVSSTMKCFGFGAYAVGDDTAGLEVLGCANEFDEDGSLLITFGTSFVVSGDENGAGNFSEWSTAVAFEVRTRVSHYYRGIGEAESNSQANADAYALFLSRAFPSDVINLNKYGILYRHCDLISLPVQNGTDWEEECDFASSEVRVTATVEGWAVVLAVFWVTAVTTGRMGLKWVAARKKMPDEVFGEQHILRRWAIEASGRPLAEGGDGGGGGVGREALLSVSVEEGAKTARITAVLDEDDASLTRRRTDKKLQAKSRLMSVIDL
ncbi:hypothetical protein FGB62_148g04 [Gracilaria domingensis]|nr:hypothetical protein FGB62_148g04 [Gracilaria domingensis]